MLKREIGDAGESVACDYLAKKSWPVLQRNFYSKYGEIDIVAKDPTGTLVFCEVKTYKPNSLVGPIEAVTPQKMQKIHKTAWYYISQHHLEHTPARIDLIIVREGIVVEHLENIGS